MASNMKAVKLRIKSVQNTMQITKAMQLVASSKLRKAKERADICRPYFKELLETLKDIAFENKDFSSAYVREGQNDRYCYVMIAGDRGLAGGYNSNLFKAFEAEASERDCVVLPIGKKAVEYCKRKNIQILTEEFAEVAHVTVSDCYEMANLVCKEFKNGSIGHVRMAYTEFVSMLSQRAQTRSLLPVRDLMIDNPETGTTPGLILYEPNSEEVFEAIVPEYLGGLIYGGICEGFASELAARRTAMEAATNNAEEMIEKLNLYYNRARQASITQEITEIVAGAEGV